MQNQHALEEEKKKRIAMPDWERLEATEQRAKKMTIQLEFEVMATDNYQYMINRDKAIISALKPPLQAIQKENDTLDSSLRQLKRLTTQMENKTLIHGKGKVDIE